MDHLRLLQLDLLELEVCLVVVAAVVAPSSLILQVLLRLVSKNLQVAWTEMSSPELKQFGAGAGIRTSAPLP